MFFSHKPIKLVDARQHGSGSELFIVEGDSAASTVAALRDGVFQAVLPMQGKPLNALKASRDKVLTYPLFRAIFESLGIPAEPNAAINQARFERVVLLFDPDADGIHSGALMLMFIHRYLPALLTEGRVVMIHAPWVQIVLADEPDAPAQYAFSEAHAQALAAQLRAQGKTPQVVRYRGLAGIDRAVLMRTCIDPQTRHERVMSPEDALAAIEVFGGAGGTGETGD